MTINIPIETYRRYLTAVQILNRIVAFAKEIPEANREPASYIVPPEEIRDARRIVSELYPHQAKEERWERD